MKLLGVLLLLCALGSSAGHTAESGNPNVKDINFEAYQWGFLPETVIVKKGDFVRLRAVSRDVTHGIYIKEYGINTSVKKGEVKIIEFPADKSGVFDIVCSVYCGEGHSGMKAKLIVEK